MHLIHLTHQTAWLSLAYPKCAQNIYTNLQLGNYLEFHLKINCLPLLFTRSRRHRWACCRHDEMQNPISKNAGNPVVHGRVSVVYPCDHMAVWEPPLLPSIMHIASLEKVQNSKSGFYECVLLSHQCKGKNSSLILS